MKMKIKTVLLICAFIAGIFIPVACSQDTGGADNAEDAGLIPDNITEAEPAEPESAEDLRLSIPDDLPERNFNGYEFRVIARERDDFVQEVGADLEEIGEVINDAIYYRNAAVEERFNIKIKGTHMNMPQTAVKNAVLAGEDAYDLMLSQVVETGSTVVEGNYLDWFGLPYVNLDKPWYINNAADTLSVNNKAYIMSGEYCLSILRFTYCKYFNKQIAADFGIPDFYTTVRNGQWTIDYVNDIVKQVHTDINGDGVMDDQDLYGFTSDFYSAAITYQYALDNPVTRKDEHDIPQLDFYTPKMVLIVEKVYNLFFENEGALVGTWGVSGPIWNEGRAMFLNGLFWSAEDMRTSDIDYGILPYPKFDESQEQYYTMSDGAHSIMTVPTTISDPERTGIIIEALNAESYKRVIPPYYEIALKVKYTRDDESVQVLDMILEGRYFDFGYIYDGWKGAAFLLQDLLSSQRRDFASLYERREAAAQRHYQTIIDKYLE
ncbi:MAG: hypothetical protein FWH24_00275 [Oscillospiraceae bacterium]|nr:hypothetical protein [Oscillospiraceae bacterium]